MLPCVCSVIDHRGRQNVVRTSETHSAAPRVPLFCSYHILTSSVIYYWTDARQHGIYLLNRCTATWNLFVLYNKKLKHTEKMPFYFKFRPLDRHQNSTDVILCLYKRKQTDWLLCLAKNCDWFKFKIQKIKKKIELSAVITYASVL